MEAIDLNGAWFFLYFVLLAGYAVLDGFDLGIGTLSLFARDEAERGTHMDVIAPVWDGNEVWLLTAGGALFAAFPVVYAGVFSAYYLALMLLLLFLILRAVSFEFRNRVDSPAWRRLWDVAFGLGSALPSILFGVAVGNILNGLPVGPDGVIRASFLSLLNPYSLLIGLLALAMFLAHGAIFLAVKTEGALHDRVVRLVPRLWIVWVVLWIAASIATLFAAPSLLVGLTGQWVFWVVFVGLLGSLVYVPVAVKAGRLGRAFLASSIAIAATVGLGAVSLYPWLVPSSTGVTNSLDIYNAASTPRTQTVMLVIALLGMPLVIGYTVFVYRVFKGKMKVGEGYHH